MPDSPVWTIGHSTRSITEFLGLLQAHGVRQVADVRTVPRSRRYPHFGTEALAAALGGAGLLYRHIPGLGGLRKPSPVSTNLGWTNASFRGYADYMGTPSFEQALAELEALAATEPTAVMCAEAVWWRCHRQLIADALVARGHEVLHILSARAAEPHRLTAFARVNGSRVDYPGLLG